ncbi:MAG: LPS export ABC transporter ATP-binding protein [Verrucomicrobiota bacterium]
MSYTDDRDDLADLLGVEPGASSGYSEEIPETPAPKKGKAADNALPEPRQQAPVRKPVKMRPPESLEKPPAKPAASAPAQTQSRPAEPVKQAPPKQTPVPPSKELDLDDLDGFMLESEATQQPLRRQPAARQDPLPIQPAAKKQPAAQPKPSPSAAKPAAAAKQEATPGAKPKAVPAAEEPFTLPPQKQEPTQRATKPASPTPQAAPAPAAKASPTIEKTPEKKAAAPATPTVTSESKPASTGPRFSEDRGKPTSEKPLLDTHGLVKIYDGRTVVNGVDINVRPGEIVGLLGPNGAGKTTSFYMIVGLVPPNGGRVLFDGDDVTTEPMFQRARLGMGYLPQEESIFRKLTVEENIMAVMETLQISKKERKARCDELLERFSITHIRKNIALTCSGGEKRRLTIARSLVTNPSLLMLDEPFSGVDPIAVNEIQSIVEDLRKSGLAILITDHNARQTLELVDRAYLIYEGKVLREGSRDFLINDPVSRELYLGDRFTM